MIGNPRGYGKSALVAEMAFRRKEFSKRKEMPSGPVLFTDFNGAKSASDAEMKVLETIRPLFFTLFSSIPKDGKEGNLSKFFLLFFSLSWCLIFIFLLYFQIDELSHKLRLLKEVSLELSQSSTDEQVVMWVFDSFSTLVSKALASTEEKKAEYDGVISMLFRLNTAMLPIAVCSSATTAGALNESTSSRFF